MAGRVDKSKLPCNKPRKQAHGSGPSGKSHIVKACKGGKEKIIRFGQVGVKGAGKNPKTKKSAASKGKYKRSSKSNVKGARKKGATLRDWFEKENWINVATGQPCGASSRKRKKR